MTREAVPVPPLNSWQIDPVPPPTFPSATGPPRAASSAACRCSGRTWNPFWSLSRSSDVSPTTGSDHDAPDGPGRRTKSATRASRTTPTLCVLVIAIGVVSIPDSRIHSSPVISPLPLSRWQPANTGSWASPGPRGRTTVTPVRMGPRPVTSGPSPSMSVVNPTRRPATSVIAFNGPGRPRPIVIPRSRVRIRGC